MAKWRRSGDMHLVGPEVTRVLSIWSPSGFDTEQPKGFSGIQRRRSQQRDQPRGRMRSASEGTRSRSVRCLVQRLDCQRRTRAAEGKLISRAKMKAESAGTDGGGSGERSGQRILLSKIEGSGLDLKLLDIMKQKRANLNVAW